MVVATSLHHCLHKVFKAYSMGSFSGSVMAWLYNISCGRCEAVFSCPSSFRTAVVTAAVTRICACSCYGFMVFVRAMVWAVAVLKLQAEHSTGAGYCFITGARKDHSPTVRVRGLLKGDSRQPRSRDAYNRLQK